MSFFLPCPKISKTITIIILRVNIRYTIIYSLFLIRRHYSICNYSDFLLMIFSICNNVAALLFYTSITESARHLYASRTSNVIKSVSLSTPRTIPETLLFYMIAGYNKFLRTYYARINEYLNSLEK